MAVDGTTARDFPPTLQPSWRQAWEAWGSDPCLCLRWTQGEPGGGSSAAAPGLLLVFSRLGEEPGSSSLFPVRGCVFTL